MVTVACRACSAGWYGQKGDRCPRCKAEVVVTDRFKSIPLRNGKALYRLHAAGAFGAY